MQRYSNIHYFWQPENDKIKTDMENTGYREIDIMGIINVTDNSSYGNSRYLGKDGRPDTGRILDKVMEMTADGAAIIDIGACSTHPGADVPDEREEWRRLEPALEAVCGKFPDIRLSIDTFRSGIIRKAAAIVSPGKLMVNDISAGEDDPEMLHAAAEYGLPFIAMHKRGTPATMQGMCDYDDVTEEVLDYFRAFAQRAEVAGVTEWILDPGFGFAKTAEQNYRLLNELGRFTEAGLSGCGEDSPRVLVGISRKSMIYRPLGITPEESLTQTQVLHLAALERGASILRVHDVAETARTVSIYRMLHGQGFNGLSHGIGGNKDVIPGTGRTLRQ